MSVINNNLIKSRFRFGSFVILIILIPVTGILALFIRGMISDADTPPFGVFLFLALFIFTWVWLVFGELRNKANKVGINEEDIAISNYFGLGIRRVYKLDELDGFITSILPSKFDNYEYLYLMKNGKKVVTISQFYHRNYQDLKSPLMTKTSNLGHKDFNFIQEIKEIFT